MPLSSSTLAATLAALPWFAGPALLFLRVRGTPSLADIDASVELMGATPRVSVVLPARNEARHIAACLASLRASTWPDLEIIVVDDHSTDDTRALALAEAEGDPRVRVISAPDLPDDWFGKQWACHVGVRHATGSLLLFTDADTRHAPDLITRLVQMRARRGADLMSVAGRQVSGTVWEHAVQPLVFALILARYGGASTLERATRASDLVANGQCFMVSRKAYDAAGGHEAVRDFVAEDMMLAQAVWMHGFRVSLARGEQQLQTRMYDNLGALVRGWAKNIYAGGRHAMRGGRVGRRLFKVLLPMVPLLMLAPFVALLYGAITTALGEGAAASPWLVWGALASTGMLLTAAAMADPGVGWMGRLRAILAPVGAVILFGICLFAVSRGSNVRWKDRGYLAR